MEEQKYTMQCLEEYIRQGEPGQRERGEAWRVAIGLQQVDGLTPSSYLLDTARQHIDGEISISRAKELIDSYYQSASHRDDIEAQRTEEADKVSARITEILSEKTFSFSPTQLTSIHRRLFEGIYKQAGQFRDYNITKNEWVLNGETIFYADYGTISDTLNYELRTEREFSYANVPVDDAIRHLMRFCANIWQIHAFCEGNTRTTAVFMIKYLRTLGFNVLNDLFAQNSWYFRNALVRANYSNLQKGITETTVFLEHFFRSMLLGEEHSFRNRELHIDWKDAESTISTQDNDIQNQSANSTLYNLLKCNYCTLEEIAVLRVIQDNPTITQKEIAAEVGKSERTVKSLTVTLQEKEILKRVGSRRTGKWEIVIVFLLSIFLNIGQVFAQSPNYNIGDVITNPDGSKGVVFWLSPDGSGGWMCALNDVSGTFAWSTQSVAVPGFPALATPSTSTWEACATVTADTAGYSHTQKLRAAGNASAYPAAYAVDFAHGWYLPAIGQLLKLYAQQATISAVLAANGGSEISRTNCYWSSTYSENTKGYFLKNPYGYLSTSSKITAFYVRPVRSFSTRAIVYDTTLTYQWSNGAATPYANVSPSVSSSYTVTATSGFGCSNTAEVSVVVANGSSQTLYDTICAGNSGYTLNGFNLTAAQTATAGDTVCTATLSEGTCSTTVTLHLHRKAPATATLNASICPGECYYLNGMELCNAGTYTQHLTAANGCDSTLTLQLTVSTPDTTRISDVVCQGEPYTGHGFDIPVDSTAFPHTIVETVCTPSLQTGCDSCTILTLTVNPVDTVHFNETICQGEPYAGHGFVIPADSTMIPHVIVETVCTPSLQTGCDSCTILTLTVNPVDTVRFYETICQGEPYAGHGFVIPADSTMIPHVIVETVHAPSLQTGCDSITILTLTVNTIDTVRFNETICQGEPYIGHGFNIPEDSTAFPHTIVETVCTPSLQTGCDSCTILTLTVNTIDTVRFNETICQGEPYTSRGFNIPVDSTMIPHVIVETVCTPSLQTNCDSCTILTLTINPSDTVRFYETICQGEPYTGYGFNIPVDSTMIPHVIVETVCTPSLQTNCDSCTILTLTVNPVDTVRFYETICQGEPYAGHGFDIPADSTAYPHTIVETQNFASLQTGCDSITILTLTVNPVDTVHFNETICQGEQYNGHGFNIPVDSTMIPHVIVETQNFASLQTECDSITILTLTVNPINTVHFNETICQGEPYNGHGFDIPADSTMIPHVIVETVHAPSLQTGCDSCTILTLTVNPVDTVRFHETICQGEQYNGHGFNIPVDSTMIPHVIVETVCTPSLQTGCDSITILTLTVNPINTVRFHETICQGEPYNGHGFNIPVDSTMIPHVIVETVCTPSLQTGCDSCTILTLTVNPVDTMRFNETVCQGEPYTGYGFNIPADSTAFPHTIVETVCTPSLQTGCDSCTILTLTVNNSAASEFSASNCLNYTWNDSTYHTSGDYVQHFPAANGCDSVVTLHLTIIDTIRTDIVDSACFFYTWHGITYEETGDYALYYVTAQGCDSMVTLHLTINHPQNQHYTVTSCHSYTWEDGTGDTYYESGVYQHNHLDAHGCWQVDWLHLNIIPVDTVFINDSINQNNPYTAYGFNIPADSTAFPHTIVETVCTPSLQTGCDSITILTLTVNPINTVHFNETICQGEPYNGHGFNIPVDSTAFPHTIVETVCTPSLQTGCDSCTILTLTVNPVDTIRFNETICQGEPYTSHGFNIPADSTMIPHTIVETVCTPSLQTGCDSCTILTLTVNTIDTVRFNETICQGEPYIGHGFDIPADSTMVPHTIVETVCTPSLQTGCDSCTILTLTVNPVDTVRFYETICQGEPYNGHGFNIPVDSTMIPHTIVETVCTPSLQTGCDSCTILTLTVNPVDTVRFNETICQGEPYNGHGFDIPIESTAFLHTIVGTRRATSLQTGCDSITILTLTVLPSYDITLEDRVCQGNAYENHGFNIPADSTMTPHVIVETQNFTSLQTGCDSTVTLNLSVIEESVIIIGPSVDFCETSTALLEAESPMSNFVWNTGETTQSIVVTSPGTYTVVAIEGNCSASAQYVITPCEFTLHLPNSITAANADGLNDIFQIAEIQQVQIKDEEFSIVIYDRWGIKVFHSYDKAFQWDGKVNGRVLEGNMYVYHISYKDLFNRFKTLRGTVITF